MKLLCVVLAGLVPALAAHGQQAEAGLKGGGTLYSLTAPINRQVRWVPGYHAGGFLALRLSGRVAGQIELLYLQQGGRGDSGVAGTRLEDHVRLHTLALPVMGKLYLGGQTVCLQLGGQVSVLLRATAQRLYTNSRLFRSSSTGYGAGDVTGRFHTADVALLGGVGVELPAGVTISLRYGVGLRNVNADAEEAAYRARHRLGAPRSRGGQLAVGWVLVAR